MGLRTHIYLIDRGGLLEALEGRRPASEVVDRAVAGWAQHHQPTPAALDRIREEFAGVVSNQLSILRDGGTPVHRGEVDPYSDEAAQDEQLTYKLETFLESLCLGYCKEMLLGEHPFDLYWDTAQEAAENGISQDVADFLRLMASGRHPNGDPMTLVESCFGFLFADEAVEVFLALRHNPKMRQDLKKGWDELILRSMNRKLQPGEAFFFWSCD